MYFYVWLSQLLKKKKKKKKGNDLHCIINSLDRFLANIFVSSPHGNQYNGFHICFLEGTIPVPSFSLCRLSGIAEIVLNDSIQIGVHLYCYIKIFVLKNYIHTRKTCQKLPKSSINFGNSNIVFTLIKVTE